MATSSEQPSFASVAAPAQETIAHLQRMLVRRYRLPVPDAEDVTNDAVVDYLRSPKGDKGDGLLFIMARRRASDLLKRRKRETSLSGNIEPAVLPDREHLHRELLERSIRRYARRHRGIDGEKLIAVATRILDNSSFAEACRECGIPRGSHSRYRKNLEGFLDRLKRR